MNEVQNREMYEAISAGENALRSLRVAQKELDSARNWGIFDLFGGNLIVDMVKHSKMNNAERCMENARVALMRFRKELEDVDVYVPNLEISDFLKFADFFFDGLIPDLMVQSRINDARQQIQNTISHVESILAKLRYEYDRWV